MAKNNWVFGLDIESLGLPGKAEIGPVKVTGDVRHKLFSVAISQGGTGQPAFLGQTVVPQVFSMRKFLQLGETGNRVHSLNMRPEGLTGKMLDYLQAHGYHTPGSDIMSVNDAQMAYLGETAPNRQFLRKFVTPTETEVAKHGGTLYRQGEGALLDDFVNHIEGIVKSASAAGETPILAGHNINRFDIPFLLDRLQETNPSAADRLREALKKFNVVDTGEKARTLIQEAYMGAPEHLSGDELVKKWRTRPERAKGWNLDVVAEMIGKGRASQGAHGPLEDAALSVQVMEGLEGRTITYQEHLQALRKIHPHIEMPSGVSTAHAVQLPPLEPTPQKATASPKLPKLAHRGIFQKATKGKLAAFAGALGLGYLLFGSDEDLQSARDASNTLLDSIMHPVAKRTEYISSSTLGLVHYDDIVGRVYDPIYGDILRDESKSERERSENIMDAGNSMHEMIQRNLLASGEAIEAERYVEDTRNKVFGYIDVILKGGIPLEIKSVSEQQLRSMRAPKPSAVSQANFYALVTESPVAQIMYVAREAPQLRKTFTIAADPSRYLGDIDRIRQIQAQFKGAPSSKPYLSNFRPLHSWFGGGLNYNMPYSQRSKTSDQKLRLAGLPMSQNWAQTPNREHMNASRAGVN